MNSSYTIEPHLIALLNDAVPAFPASPSLELPPLQNPAILKASDRPLPLEPDTRKPNREPDPSSQLASSHQNLLITNDEDEGLNKNDEKSSNSNIINERMVEDFSRQSLSKILDDDEETKNTSSTKKRTRTEPNKDDFVQLPQPLKKHKTAKQVVPPIIIGLFQPPPQSTLLPPISSSSFDDSRTKNSINSPALKSKLLKEKLDFKTGAHNEKLPTASDGVRKTKTVAARRKWTEEETNNLLLGVHKHGVGCWADILSDPGFVFNGRSSSDLKDRWRTCCPDELRKNISSDNYRKKPSAKTELRPGLSSRKKLIHNEWKLTECDNDQSGFTSRQKKRSHRKELEDLFQLGIEGPIRQSNRRERRQFTKDEDHAIIEGHNLFGPAWSKIQKDPRLNLQSRQPTDLRDRFRNMFPEKFRENKGCKISVVAPKKARKRECKTKGIVNLSQEDSNNRDCEASAKESCDTSAQLILQSLPSRDGLRIQEIILSEPFNALVDHPPIDSVEALPLSQFSEWNSSAAVPFSNIIGEMDISRLLLDETWSEISQDKEKNSSLESNNLLTPSSEPLNQMPPLFNMSNDNDDLNEVPFG